MNQEGRQMHHCVASYSWSCSKGVTSVWSMEEMGRDGQQKMLTLEVSNRERRIVQARGKYNSMPTQVDRRIMRIWA
ncbi:PcfJ domain-containing protein, partial [Vibrio parahaemolyticus]